MASDRDVSPPSDRARSGWRWGPAAFLSALHSLTALPERASTRAIGASAVFYPIIGLLLGAVALLVDWGASFFPGLLARSSAVLVAGAFCTGARPQRALGHLIGASLRKPSRSAVLQKLEETESTASLALTAMVGIVELACLYELDRFRAMGLLFAPVLARCSMVVLAVGSRAARRDGRRTKFAPDLTFNEFAVASASTFALIFLTSEFLGLLLVLSAAFLTIGLRVLSHRWLDGVNRTVLDAACELSTLTTLALLAWF